MYPLKGFSCLHKRTCSKMSNVRSLFMFNVWLHFFASNAALQLRSFGLFSPFVSASNFRKLKSPPTFIGTPGSSATRSITFENFSNIPDPLSYTNNTAIFKKGLKKSPYGALTFKPNLTRNKLAQHVSQNFSTTAVDVPSDPVSEEKIDDSNVIDFANEEEEARDSFMSPMGPLELNNKGDIWLPQQSRPMRNRKTRNIRKMIQEATVRPSNLVLPVFVHDQEGSEDIASMPSLKYYTVQSLLKEVEQCMKLGINSFMLFPVISQELRTSLGEESYNEDGLIPQAVSAIKQSFPDSIVFTDIALDPYLSNALDCIQDEETGKILNDQTVQLLCKMALSHAYAGADFVSPSDMMDGRVSAIRDVLDAEGFTDTSIMSYTSKFASKLYSPFRRALKNSRCIIDKGSFQQDFSNARESLIEANLDVTEGADILLVKPGTLYLDILAKMREKTSLPLGVYHVSGEYAMIKAAAEKNYIDEKEVVMEQMKALRRAGADVIVTYYAKELAQWLHDDFYGNKEFAELSF